MSEYITDGVALTYMADRIRAKTGGTARITWDAARGFGDVVDTIETNSDVGASVVDDIITRSIASIANSRVTEVGDGAFYNCRELSSANFPVATSIGLYAFYGCSRLSSVNFPVATSIGSGAFFGCHNLRNVNFPEVTTVVSSAFMSCSRLSSVNFPVATSIGSNAFFGCSSLSTLILRETNGVCKLSDVGALKNTRIASGAGYVYVPAALAEDYKTATYWSTYADQIRAIEDYPDITGG